VPPAVGMDAPWSWARVQDLLKHLWIPAIILSIAGTAQFIRILRANLLDELRKPYVVTARAKGLSTLGAHWGLWEKVAVGRASLPGPFYVSSIDPDVLSRGRSCFGGRKWPMGLMLIRSLIWHSSSHTARRCVPSAGRKLPLSSRNRCRHSVQCIRSGIRLLRPSCCTRTSASARRGHVPWKSCVALVSPCRSSA